MSVREYSVASLVKLLDMDWLLRIRLGGFVVSLPCLDLLMSFMVDRPSGVTAVRGYNVLKTCSSQSAEPDLRIRLPAHSKTQVPDNQLNVLKVTAIEGFQAYSHLLCESE